MFDQDMKAALSELWGWIIVDFLLVAYSMLNNGARGRLNTVSIILCSISAVFSLCCILDVKLLEETALYNGTVGKVMESCTFLAIFLSAASLFYVVTNVYEFVAVAILLVAMLLFFTCLFFILKAGMRSDYGTK